MSDPLDHKTPDNAETAAAKRIYAAVTELNRAISALPTHLSVSINSEDYQDFRWSTPRPVMSARVLKKL